MGHSPTSGGPGDDEPLKLVLLATSPAPSRSTRLLWNALGGLQKRRIAPSRVLHAVESGPVVRVGERPKGQTIAMGPAHVQTV